jgi:hypothetical protein
MTGWDQDSGGQAGSGFRPLPRSNPLTDERALRFGPIRREGAWRAEPGAGMLVGLALLLASVVVLALALQAATGAPAVARIFWFAIALVALGGAVVVGVLLVRLRSMRYTITGVGVVVAMRGQRIAVPYEDIVDVTFRPRDRIDIGGFERYWPGYYDAEVSTSEGVWRSVATTPPNLRVRLRLRDGRTLAISPERPILFVEALESFRRGARMPVRHEQPVIERLAPPVEAPAGVTGPARVPAMPPSPRLTPPPALPAWVVAPEAFLIFRDRIVRGDRLASNLLALTLILLIVLVTVTVWRADAVGSPVAVHWNANGQPVRTVRPSGFWVFEGVWIFPVTAAAALAINAALATLAVVAGRLRAAQVLLAAVLPVEAILLIGLLRATA